ncbi:hypothetical protein [Bradyrhizobium hereditatis]
MIRNIHLTEDPDEIKVHTDKVKGPVLRTDFLKRGVRSPPLIILVSW